ncbi:ArsR/SmtB family transcription factor [Streptacidiphilus sp. MAP12-33]|uniref:ArsR/SmtB family transcription factor n=1 Tax=Streptacidiphilus sp. MAP12-33 TaxID=3156266 RepID=UPI003512CDB6
MPDAADLAPEVVERMASGFALLSSPIRLRMVWLLAAGESDVSALAARVGAALPAVSQHLAKLKLGGLVRSRREGRRQIYFLDEEYAKAFVRLAASQLHAAGGGVPYARVG